MPADTLEPAHLSSLIASRVCHDLVSPVSGITNAMDFLNEPLDQDMKAQTEALLKDSVLNAERRLKFLRYALGSQGLNSGTADIHEAKEVTEGFIASHKFTTVFDIETSHFGYSHARLMMNMVMIATDSMSRAGEIIIKIRDEAAGLAIVITAKGEKANLRPDTINGLAGEPPADGWTGRAVQPLFASIIANNLGSEVSARQVAEDEVVVSALGVRAEG